MCIWLDLGHGLEYAVMTKILRHEQYSTNIHDHYCVTSGFSSFLVGLLKNSWIALKMGAADTSMTL